MEKRTFKDLSELDQLVGMAYQRDDKLKNTKFGYAYKKFTEKNYIPLVKEFQEEIQNVRIDHALEDPTTKEILSDKNNFRGYRYSKAGLKQVMVEERKIVDKWNEKEVEIIPYICASIPEELEPEEIEKLKGLVL